MESTYCHNTWSFADWEGSTPQRVTAWHGIRMRDINTQYLTAGPCLPGHRLGPMRRRAQGELRYLPPGA